MKKIVFELQPCCAKRSGIGLYAYELARRMRDTGEFSFCGQIFNFLGRNDNSSFFNGVQMPIHESRLIPYGIYRRIWNALPIPHEVFSGVRADLSIFFNYIVPPRLSGKVIDTICDMTYLRFPETMNARNFDRITAGIATSVERSAKIVTISEFSKREIIELLQLPKEMISVVPCAPSLARESAEFESVKARYGISKPFILYVGTIEPRKNLIRLIHAFDRLKLEEGIEHLLVLAGGPGWRNEEIYLAAQQASCKEDIRFVGYITAEEKNAFYQHASVLAFPSLYEGFGMPPLEAMTWDCPVVCANAASIPEVVGEAARLVDPKNEVDIAQGIWDVLSNPDYADNLITRGRIQVKKYTWDESAEKLLRVCREVLEK